MDLHAAQIQGFFNIPLDHLLGGPTLYSYFKSKKIVDENFVVVSPDIGSVSRARNVASKLNCPMAIIDKRRPKANVMEVMNIIGDIDGKKCLMVDDMIDYRGYHLSGRAGARRPRRERSVRLLHARGFKRPRHRTARRLAHQGTGDFKHHRSSPRKDAG